MPVEPQAIDQALRWAQLAPRLRAHGGTLEKMVLVPDVRVGAGIPTLLVQTRPDTGLTAAHVDTLLHWAARL